MRKKVKTKKVPKHILGALIGTAASIGMSLFNKNKEAKAQRRAQRQAALDSQEATYGQQKLIDTQALANYEDNGVGTVDYYQKKGGKLPMRSSYKTKGGDLKPISSDTELAVGNKHSQSTIDNTTGIKLLQGNKPFAEIEGGETIKDGKKVFSDTLTVDGKITYADASKKLATEKGKIEQDMKNKDKIGQATGKRKIVVLDKTEDALFMKQEESKKGMKQNETGLPKGKNGIKFADSKIGKGVSALLPFADNIVNAILTKNTPKLIKPQLQTPEALKTRYNANPELGAVRDAVKSSTTNIMQNTSNSASARNAVTAVNLEGSRQTGKVLANKENIETGLKNRAALNRQQVNARNVAVTNRQSEMEVARLGDIQNRYSTNVANAVGDVIDKRNFDATQNYNKERLDIARNYDINGTSMRADLNNPTEIAKLKTDDTYYQEQLIRYKDNPKELARLKALRTGRTLAVPNI